MPQKVVQESLVGSVVGALIGGGMNWSSIKAKELAWWRCVEVCVVGWSKCAVVW